MNRSTRTPRIVAAVLGLLVLVLIGAFVAMALVTRDEVRLGAVGPLGKAPGLERGGVRFAGALNVWEVQGSLGADRDATAHLSLSLRGPTGQPPGGALPLTARLARPGDDGDGIAVPLSRTGPGLYAGRAPLAEGRWVLRLGLPEVTGTLAFAVDPL